MQNGGTWQGQMPIGTPGAVPPGADLAASNQFGIPGQTDAWVADTASTIQVFWVAGAPGGPPWKGPLAI